MHLVPVLKIHLSGWLSYVTMTAEDEEDSGVAGKDYVKDPKIARYRSVVERCFSAMKQWKILSNEHLLSKLKIDEVLLIVTVVAALTNVKQRMNNKSW